MFANGRAAGRDRANDSFGVVAFFLSTSQNGGDNYKRIVLLAIELPVACLCIVIMSAKFTIVKFYNIEPSRTSRGGIPTFLADLSYARQMIIFSRASAKAIFLAFFFRT